MALPGDRLKGAAFACARVINTGVIAPARTAHGVIGEFRHNTNPVRIGEMQENFAAIMGAQTVNLQPAVTQGAKDTLETAGRVVGLVGSATLLSSAQLALNVAAVVPGLGGCRSTAQWIGDNAFRWQANVAAAADEILGDQVNRYRDRADTVSVLNLESIWIPEQNER
jgi:hypothetical protein